MKWNKLKIALVSTISALTLGGITFGIVYCTRNQGNSEVTNLNNSATTLNQEKALKNISENGKWFGKSSLDASDFDGYDYIEPNLFDSAELSTIQQITLPSHIKILTHASSLLGDASNSLLWPNIKRINILLEDTKNVIEQDNIIWALCGENKYVASTISNRETTTISFPQSINNNCYDIANNFYNDQIMKNITSISFASNCMISTFGNNCFKNCKIINNANLTFTNQQLITFGDSAFENSNIKAVSVSNAIHFSAGKNCFKGSMLSNINVDCNSPGNSDLLINVINIGDYALSNVSSTCNASLSAKTISIGSNAYSGNYETLHIKMICSAIVSLAADNTQLANIETSDNPGSLSIYLKGTSSNSYISFDKFISNAGLKMDQRSSVTVDC